MQVCCSPPPNSAGQTGHHERPSPKVSKGKGRGDRIKREGMHVKKEREEGKEGRERGDGKELRGEGKKEEGEK